MGNPRALDVKEICRSKLAIFYGSVNNYEHGLKEAIANGKDIINKKFESGEITINLSDNKKIISIKDTGSGIDINLLDDENHEPMYKLYFETLFAGGNMDNADEKIESVGTNGCGTCVLNHISTFFKVTSARDGKIFELLYTDGGNFQYFKEIGETDETYSIFEFELDNEVYPITEYNVNSLKDICKHNVAVDNKITLHFNHLGETITYHYDSIDDYFDENTTSKTSINFHPNAKTFHNKYIEYDDNHNPEEKEEDNTIECILATSSESYKETYLNGNYLPDNGAIYDGIILGIRNVINKYCKDKKLLDKKSGVLSKEDIEDSFSFVCSLRSTRVEFENQTKFKTSKELYKSLANEYILSQLEIFSIENPSEFEKMIKHVLEIHKFNSKSNDNKKQLKKKLSENINNITNRIKNLVDCKEHGENSEIFIAEGLSALGSLVSSRCPKNQAIIPIRGKILNLIRASVSDVEKSEIIQGLIKAIGCGSSNKKYKKIFGEYNPNNLRYGKIMMATDRDDDALDIICLILTMFYEICPEMLYEGRLYTVLTPLYIVTLTDDSIIYWFSEEEHDNEINKYRNIKKITRSKGLGSNTPEIMAETAMNPETRHVIQITVGDRGKMDEAFRIWRDIDVTERKKIIETELYKYKFTD